jgi:hypothetical protein
MSVEAQTGAVSEVYLQEDGAVFVKVVSNGTPVGKVSGPQFDRINRKLRRINPVDVDYKIIKSSPQASGGLKASPGWSGITGDQRTRIISTKGYGNFIVGPTTFVARPEEIRIGGAFKLNPLLTSTMPSTIVTPLPVLLYDPKIIDTLENITKQAADFLNVIGEL